MENKTVSAKWTNYWILFAIMLFSIVCRLISTSGSNVIPGLGGMYYPLQVRCLLERGALGYSDMPLVFWIEALAAKLIILTGLLPVNNAIVLACRLVNALVPSLIVIPVFYLARSIFENTAKPGYLAVVLALSVLNPSVLVVFAVDFDKNAISMLFVYMTIYYLWQYINSKTVKPAVMTVVSVLLTLLTHFGCFSALFAFLLILALVMGFSNAGRLIQWFRDSRIRIVILTIILAALIMLPVLVLHYDDKRFFHLASLFASPLQLFENSLFLLMLKGKFILDLPNLFFFIVINSFSVLSVITYFRLRKRMGREESAFFLSLVLWFVFLSNPFINTDIFRRLLFISLIPLTIVIIFFFRYFRKPVRRTIAVILALLLILTVATCGIRKTYISKDEYTELLTVRNMIQKPDSAIVLAQHRLEFWTSWTLRMKSGQLMGIKPKEYSKYSQVLYIVQKSNSRFQEEIPKTAVLIHGGKYFDLYKIH
jgi:hypothetical protein